MLTAAQRTKEQQLALTQRTPSSAYANMMRATTSGKDKPKISVPRKTFKGLSLTGVIASIKYPEVIKQNHPTGPWVEMMIPEVNPSTINFVPPPTSPAHGEHIKRCFPDSTEECPALALPEGETVVLENEYGRLVRRKNGEHALHVIHFNKESTMVDGKKRYPVPGVPVAFEVIENGSEIKFNIFDISNALNFVGTSTTGTPFVVGASVVVHGVTHSSKNDFVSWEIGRMVHDDTASPETEKNFIFNAPRRNEEWTPASTGAAFFHSHASKEHEIMHSFWSEHPFNRYTEFTWPERSDNTNWSKSKTNAASGETTVTPCINGVQVVYHTSKIAAEMDQPPSVTNLDFTITESACYEFGIIQDAHKLLPVLVPGSVVSGPGFVSIEKTNGHPGNLAGGVKGGAKHVVCVINKISVRLIEALLRAGIEVTPEHAKKCLLEWHGTTNMLAVSRANPGGPADTNPLNAGDGTVVNIRETKTTFEFDDPAIGEIWAFYSVTAINGINVKTLKSMSIKERSAKLAEVGEYLDKGDPQAIFAIKRSAIEEDRARIEAEKKQDQQSLSEAIARYEQFSDVASSSSSSSCVEEIYQTPDVSDSEYESESSSQSRVRKVPGAPSKVRSSRASRPVTKKSTKRTLSTTDFLNIPPVVKDVSDDTDFLEDEVLTQETFPLAESEAKRSRK